MYRLIRRFREQARSHIGLCSAFVDAQLLDTDLAHAEFLDLARHGHRKLLDELEVTRRLEVRDALLAPCLLYTSPSPRDGLLSRMPSSA